MKQQSKAICLIPCHYKMTSNNKIRKTDVKNCTYHYFDGIININELDSKNIKVDTIKSLIKYKIK